MNAPLFSINQLLKQIARECGSNFTKFRFKNELNKIIKLVKLNKIIHDIIAN